VSHDENLLNAVTSGHQSERGRRHRRATSLGSISKGPNFLESRIRTSELETNPHKHEIIQQGGANFSIQKSIYIKNYYHNNVCRRTRPEGFCPRLRRCRRPQGESRWVRFFFLLRILTLSLATSDRQHPLAPRRLR
jgi:hypothetical protein